jgi:hypothetical protein
MAAARDHVVPDRPRAVHAARGWHVVLVLTTALALGWLVLTSLVAPMRLDCDPVLPQGECRESVTAAMARGLPRPHGLLLAAHVASGPDRAPGQLGHRATVTFDVLGAPAPIGVALYLDLGGHWGGVVDRGRIEVTSVPIIQAALVAVVGLGLAWLMRGRGRERSGERGEEGSHGAG